MRVLDKTIIGAYALAILDLMEHHPSKENTKNIYETLEEIYAEWDELYDYGRLPVSENEAKEYVEIGFILDELTDITAEYVVADAYLDFDCNKMVYGLIQLVKIGGKE